MSRQFTKVPKIFEYTSERYGTTITDAAPYPITITYYYKCTDDELDDIAYQLAEVCKPAEDYIDHVTLRGGADSTLRVVPNRDVAAIKAHSSSNNINRVLPTLLKHVKREIPELLDRVDRYDAAKAAGTRYTRYDY